MARYALGLFRGPILLPDAPVVVSIPDTNVVFYARSGYCALYTREYDMGKNMVIVPIDDYSPILVGDTGNTFSIQVLHKNGYKSILGASITMKMQNVDNPTTIKTCTGIWSIDPADNGKASYQYQASDVDTAGSWYMWVKVVLNGKPVHVDDGAGNPKILVIKPLQSGL